MSRKAIDANLDGVVGKHVGCRRKSGTLHGGTGCGDCVQTWTEPYPNGSTKDPITYNNLFFHLPSYPVGRNPTAWFTASMC